MEFLRSLQELNDSLDPAVKVKLDNTEKRTYLCVPPPTEVYLGGTKEGLTWSPFIEWVTPVISVKVINEPDGLSYVYAKYAEGNPTYFQTNAPHSFRNLSQYYLGAHGTMDDYLRYKGNWYYDWEGLRYIDTELSSYFIQGFLSQGTDRLLEVLRELANHRLHFLRPAAILQILSMCGPGDLKAIAEKMPVLVQEVFARGVHTHVAMALLDMGCQPDRWTIEVEEERVRDLKAAWDRGNRAAALSVWDQLASSDQSGQGATS